MKYTACQAAFLLSAHGITDVVISPGSRNAPLVAAFYEYGHHTEEKRPSMNVHMIIDERSAAFVALGMAVATQRPVALVCTSGTALLNYAPAVAEAFYQGIPLILLTADRPQQWIDQDDSQTIHQPEALARIVKGNFNLPDSGDKEMDWYANRIINEAILLSMDSKPGPVHINMQFAAPLTDMTPKQCKQVRVIKEVKCESLPKKADMLNLAGQLLTKRVLVVIGFMPPSASLRRAVNAFSSLHNVAILTEKTANLHLPGPPAGIDTILGIGEFPVPDIVITLGGALVSRHVKAFLRNVGDNTEHWSLDRNPYLADCFCKLSLRIKAEPAIFLTRLTHHLRKANVTGNYHILVENRKILALQRQKKIIDQSPWCDLKAHDIIFKELPPSLTVFCSNGTAIRYAELMAPATLRGLYCNRGTSGIEGCTSTAVGSALATGRPTLLMTGDMCFRHDIAGLKVAPDNIRIIVFNNGGGDIFRFIPSTRNLDIREECFACPGLMTPEIEMLASTFRFNYFRCDDPKDLKTKLHQLFADEKKGILEVDTSHCDNAGILTDFFEKLYTND